MPRILAFLTCVIALLLPWRLRLFYSRLIGGVLRIVYWSFYSLTRLLLRQLQPKSPRP